jgi:hypothetical protein
MQKAKAVLSVALELRLELIGQAVIAASSVQLTGQSS